MSTISMIRNERQTGLICLNTSKDPRTPQEMLVFLDHEINNLKMDAQLYPEFGLTVIRELSLKRDDGSSLLDEPEIFIKALPLLAEFMVYHKNSLPKDVLKKMTSMTDPQPISDNTISSTAIPSIYRVPVPTSAPYDSEIFDFIVTPDENSNSNDPKLVNLVKNRMKFPLFPSIAEENPNPSYKITPCESLCDKMALLETHVSKSEDTAALDRSNMEEMLRSAQALAGTNPDHALNIINQLFEKGGVLKRMISLLEVLADKRPNAVMDTVSKWVTNRPISQTTFETIFPLLTILAKPLPSKVVSEIARSITNEESFKVMLPILQILAQHIPYHIPALIPHEIKDPSLLRDSLPLLITLAQKIPSSAIDITQKMLVQNKSGETILYNFFLFKEVFPLLEKLLMADPKKAKDLILMQNIQGQTILADDRISELMIPFMELLFEE